MSRDRMKSTYASTPRDMTRSDAYRASSMAAKVLVHHLLDLCTGESTEKWHSTVLNGEIKLTVAQVCDALGCSKPTALKAIAEVAAKGLAFRTHIADQTAPGPGRKADVTLWMVTCLPYRDEKGHSKPARFDYRSWHPGFDLGEREQEVRRSSTREAARPVPKADPVIAALNIMSEPDSAMQERAQKTERPSDSVGTQRREIERPRARPRRQETILDAPMTRKRAMAMMPTDMSAEDLEGCPF